PVIGLNIGTRSEWIQDGQNGYLCSPHDLGETIQKSAHCDNYEQMVAHAYHCAKPYFLNEVMNKQLTIYEKILNHA
ncbi:MAG TPA: glycosyl transferase family 1, partial [Gammaproteobacteria bacterium]|nr:glycosyl transferase family 1 [Gammaproteobacteria bacterium]